MVLFHVLGTNIKNYRGKGKFDMNFKCIGIMKQLPVGLSVWPIYGNALDEFNQLGNMCIRLLHTGTRQKRLCQSYTAPSIYQINSLVAAVPFIRPIKVDKKLDSYSFHIADFYIGFAVRTTDISDIIL